MTTMTQMEQYLDSSPLLDDPHALQQRAEEDGYLYFKRLLSPDKILAIRKQVLQTCQKHGWLDERAPLMDGIARKGVCFIESNDPQWKAYYCEIQKIRDFHALCLDPALINVFGKVFGETAIPHSRNICRTIFPGMTKFTTPAHQDFPHIKGTHETWTAWIPCGDCPSELGGLAVVPGSHKLGELPTKAAYGAGGAGVDVSEESVWVAGELKCGDILLFQSLTVHQGRDNVSENKLCLSMDFRYQPLSHSIAHSSMMPHQNWLTWDEVYASWPKNDSTRFYWEKWKLKYV